MPAQGPAPAPTPYSNIKHIPAADSFVWLHGGLQAHLGARGATEQCRGPPLLQARHPRRHEGLPLPRGLLAQDVSGNSTFGAATPTPQCCPAATATALAPAAILPVPLGQLPATTATLPFSVPKPTRVQGRQSGPRSRIMRSCWSKRHVHGINYREQASQRHGQHLAPQEKPPVSNLCWEVLQTVMESSSMPLQFLRNSVNVSCKKQCLLCTIVTASARGTHLGPLGRPHTGL